VPITHAMSELQQPSTRPVAPSQAPGTVAPGSDGAAEVYRRAVQAKPTGFTENPIGAMAQAVDKIGKAAGHVFASKGLEGQDGLASGEAKLKEAIGAMRANPGSLEAKQKALAAALKLLEQMGQLPPNDPRRLSVSKFAVGLANQLGAAGIPFGMAGTDVRGLLRIAAQVLSRFGSSADMQAAFKLESMLKASLPASSAQAVAVRAELMQRFGLSQSARSVLESGWAVRLAHAGEVPKLDLSARTIVLDATQSNPSLGVLARAYWQDQSMRSPQERDGFVEAFRKVANQSTMGGLSRKYREVRDHARRELQQGRIGVLGSTGAAPTGAAGTLDESADMFASLASFSQAGDGGELPGELRSPLERFFAPQ
jgi:hypothetical protein